MQTETEGLIARLEAATGPDRELDAAIFCFRHEGFAIVEGDVLAIQGGFKARVSSTDLPRYTSSLDDALTLVPEGIPWWVGCNLKRGVYEACTAKQRATSASWSPAIALCIAALKARMQKGGE